jgi:hypothetical protein
MIQRMKIEDLMAFPPTQFKAERTKRMLAMVCDVEC